MQTRSKILILGTIMSVTMIAFQNCGAGKVTASPYSSSSTNTTSGSDNTVGGPVAQKLVTLEDTSYGDGTKLKRVRQKVRGAGANLKGCTVTISMASQYCKSDSEYRLVTSGDSWQYDAESDTYSTDFDGANFPQAIYITRYLLADGTRTELQFTPMIFVDTSYGNGNTLTKIQQKLTGAGANLKGCTVPTSMASQYCLNDSDYRLITSGDNWQYNLAIDTYWTSFDAGTSWPQTSYITRYIRADGVHFDVTFIPYFNVSYL